MTASAILVVAACIFAALSSSSSSSSRVLALPRNLTSILGHYPEFSNFNTLLQETSVAEEIDSMGSATLFVPDNSKILKDLIFQLRVDPSTRDLLADLCKFHATSRFLDLQGFQSNSTTRVPTLLHNRSFLIKVDARGDISIVDSNRSSLGKPAVIQGNIQSPGKLAVYSIDRVLSPAYAFQPPSRSSRSGSTPASSPGPMHSDSMGTSTNSSASSASSSSGVDRLAVVCGMFAAVFIALLARI